MVVTFLCISMTGWLQIFGYDLLNIEWVQQFIMSKEQFVQYGGEIADVFRGNHVFLTLYNPNYAAAFLIMFSAVLVWVQQCLHFAENKTCEELGNV